MGADCARSYQGAKNIKSKELSKAVPVDNKMYRRCQFRFVLVQERCWSKGLEGTASENIIQYQTELNDCNPFKKFTARVGFHNSQKSIELSKGDLLFRFVRTDNKQIFLEI